jgi:hypothetical protein
MRPDQVLPRAFATVPTCLSLGSLAMRCDAQAAEPFWRVHVTPWESTAEDARPWRSDARLAGRSEPGYPDDFQVRFANPDSARGGKPEFMWVRTIAYDASADRFLGILINAPFVLRDPREGDNVAFSVRSSDGQLLAEGAPRFADAGWPAAPSPFTTALRAGIRAYRDGHNGHTMPGIERCITTLQRGVALLAELTIANHRRETRSGTPAALEWERQFGEELAVIRQRFGGDPLVRRIVSVLFDQSQ